ncbi:hypothetical protein LY78DRAFT_665955 [Colletotrichum sublineola]|nr:hypothetical protein LY78DRAFT_665955 [Colletotrichum sublineola]
MNTYTLGLDSKASTYAVGYTVFYSSTPSLTLPLLSVETFAGISLHVDPEGGGWRRGKGKGERGKGKWEMREMGKRIRLSKARRRRKRNTGKKRKMEEKELAGEERRGGGGGGGGVEEALLASRAPA